MKCLSLPRIWGKVKTIYRRRNPGDVPKGMSTLMSPLNKPQYPAREDQLQKLVLYCKRNKLTSNWHLGLELHFSITGKKNNSGTQREKGGRVRRCGRLTCSAALPERSCLMRPLLVAVSTGRKSLNQEISGSGLPLAAQSMVAVRAFSTTFSCGPMSMVGKPAGRWSSARGENTQG